MTIGPTPNKYFSSGLCELFGHLPENMWKSKSSSCQNWLKTLIMRVKSTYFVSLTYFIVTSLHRDLHVYKIGYTSTNLKTYTLVTEENVELLYFLKYAYHLRIPFILFCPFDGNIAGNIAKILEKYHVFHTFSSEFQEEFG